MSFKLKTFLASTGLALALGPFAFSVAHAQTTTAPSGAHSNLLVFQKKNLMELGKA